MNNEIIDNIVKLLKSINNPLTNRPFDIDKDIKVIEKNGNVNIAIEIRSTDVNLYEEVKPKITEDILKLKNVLSVNVILTSNKHNESSFVKKPDTTKYNISSNNIIAIASGKGGVGKSTISVNIACELSKKYKVGLLDLDIYGPSLPILIGEKGPPKITNEQKLIPIEKFGIKFMSFGFLNTEKSPAIWRGPMVAKMTNQFFDDVDWGDIRLSYIRFATRDWGYSINFSTKNSINWGNYNNDPSRFSIRRCKKRSRYVQKSKYPSFRCN